MRDRRHGAGDGPVMAAASNRPAAPQGAAVPLKRHKLVATAQLFALGMETMAAAEAANLPDWRRALRYGMG